MRPDEGIEPYCQSCGIMMDRICDSVTRFVMDEKTVNCSMCHPCYRMLVEACVYAGFRITDTDKEFCDCYLSPIVVGEMN